MAEKGGPSVLLACDCYDSLLRCSEQLTYAGELGKDRAHMLDVLIHTFREVGT